jgi:uncharacterized membrane protein
MQDFLLGYIFATSLLAGLFFLRFWRDTRDGLFLAFAAAFTIEAFNRLTFLLVAHPSEASPLVYVVRMLAFLIIVVAIVAKNRKVRS